MYPNELKFFVYDGGASYKRDLLASLLGDDCSLSY
jgi:hypothetical protein